MRPPRAAALRHLHAIHRCATVEPATGDDGVAQRHGMALDRIAHEPKNAAAATARSPAERRHAAITAAALRDISRGAPVAGDPLRRLSIVRTGARPLDMRSAGQEPASWLL